MNKYDFDVVVIGGGAAGLTSSGMAAHLGAKTMMIEAEKLGGDCTWTGCVPSKILLKAGKVAQQMRQAGKYGLIDTEPEIDFQKVIRHVHSIRQDIYEEADAPENFEAMGIEVVQGRASFRNEHTIEIALKNGESRTVTSRFFFICVGASVVVPPIEGLDSVDYLTSESLFEIEKLPEELIIIGAGPIGTEMAQAFNRLGAEVTVIDQAERIMTNDDSELTGILQACLKEEGVEYVLGAEVNRIDHENGEIQVEVKVEGKKKIVNGTDLLLATGRTANVDGLNLEAAGINYTDKGVGINDKCRTNVSHIYACGDITGEYQFTHMSEHMAKVAVQNALLKIPKKMDREHVPWCTYADPELAHVGKTEQQLKKESTGYEVFRFPYSKVDRAVMESESEGMIKIFATKWRGKILGASIAGVNAGELICEYAVAMKNGVSLSNIADTIHPYPTYALGARRAADQWYINLLSEWQIKFVKTVFGYRGKILENKSDQII
jgi:pyruvate/2-oxoglutarate dehydrogenase complex dihydrolipoamide dehydrogenase (E3) component